MFKIKIKRHSKLETLFLAVWTFYLFYFVLFSSSELSYDYHDLSTSISRTCRYITIILLIVLFLLEAFAVKRWSRGQLIGYFILLIVVFVVEVRITDWSLILLILFVLSAQFVDFDKLLRFDIKIKIILLAVIFLLCALGIVGNRTALINGSYKMALGFSHPNTFACFALTILIEWLCIRYKKMKWYDWVVILAALIAVYNVSNSRSSIYTFIIILVLYFIANYRQRFFQTRVVRIILTTIPLLMAFLSFYMVHLYGEGNAFAIAFDSFLSGRIRWGYNGLRVNGLKWFGQEIAFSSRWNPGNGTTVFLIDNAYIRMALGWGIVIFCIILIIYMVRFFQLSKTGQIGILLMGLFFIILGFGESYMLTVCYNMTLLCLFGRSFSSGIQSTKIDKTGVADSG